MCIHTCIHTDVHPQSGTSSSHAQASAPQPNEFPDHALCGTPTLRRATPLFALLLVLIQGYVLRARQACPGCSPHHAPVLLAPAHDRGHRLVGRDGQPGRVPGRLSSLACGRSHGVKCRHRGLISLARPFFSAHTGFDLVCGGSAGSLPSTHTAGFDAYCTGGDFSQTNPTGANDICVTSTSCAIPPLRPSDRQTVSQPGCRPRSRAQLMPATRCAAVGLQSLLKCAAMGPATPKPASEGALSGLRAGHGLPSPPEARQTNSSLARRPCTCCNRNIHGLGAGPSTYHAPTAASISLFPGYPTHLLQPPYVLRPTHLTNKLSRGCRQTTIWKTQEISDQSCLLSRLIFEFGAGPRTCCGLSVL